MPKVTYDVSNVEDASDFKQAPVGIYIAKIKEFTTGKSKTADQPMGTVVLELVATSDGKKVKERYSNVWHRIPLDDTNPGWTFRLKEFIKALALPLKGGFDPDKLAGKKLQVKLKSGTDLDDNYRPEVDKLYAMPADSPEPDEPDAEDDDGEEEEGDTDYSSMTLAQLKSEVEEYEGDPDEIIEEAEATSAAAKKAALIEWLESDDEEEDEDDDSSDDEEESEEEEEPEASDDDEDDDEDGEEVAEDDYDEWSMEDLKTELKERDLKTAGKKSVLIARLRKDDSEEEPF